jgi:hypothetical protein
MPELHDPMPKRRVKPMGGTRNAVPLEPPPTPLRYVDGGVWRPNAPGFADRPGGRDTRPLPRHTTRRRAQ